MPDMEAIHSEEGWFVLHAFYGIDRCRFAELAPEAQKQALLDLKEALEAFRGPEHCQAQVYSILGHKADLGLMLVSPELCHLNRLENGVLNVFSGCLKPVYSYLSMTEISEYMSQEKDYDRTLREKEGLSPESPEYQEKMKSFRERMSFYINSRLYPTLPEHRVMCFYPMNKSRGEQHNWYSLDFDSRKRLMGGHLMTGRKFAGKVKQLVTGSTGLDAWEWGVTLFADDPLFLKKIVYEMRFDEVSAVYAEFGDFLVGIRSDPEQLFRQLGLPSAVD